eukprot:gene14891-20026_t
MVHISWTILASFGIVNGLTLFKRSTTRSLTLNHKYSDAHNAISYRKYNPVMSYINDDRNLQISPLFAKSINPHSSENERKSNLSILYNFISKYLKILFRLMQQLLVIIKEIITGKKSNNHYHNNNQHQDSTIGAKRTYSQFDFDKTTIENNESYEENLKEQTDIDDTSSVRTFSVSSKHSSSSTPMKSSIANSITQTTSSYQGKPQSINKNNYNSSKSSYPVNNSVLKSQPTTSVIPTPVKRDYSISNLKVNRSNTLDNALTRERLYIETKLREIDELNARYSISKSSSPSVNALQNITMKRNYWPPKATPSPTASYNSRPLLTTSTNIEQSITQTSALQSQIISPNVMITPIPSEIIPTIITETNIGKTDTKLETYNLSTNHVIDSTSSQIEIQILNEIKPSNNSLIIPDNIISATSSSTTASIIIPDIKPTENDEKLKINQNSIFATVGDTLIKRSQSVAKDKLSTNNNIINNNNNNRDYSTIKALWKSGTSIVQQLKQQQKPQKESSSNVFLANPGSNFGTTKTLSKLDIIEQEKIDDLFTKLDINDEIILVQESAKVDIFTNEKSVLSSSIIPTVPITLSLPQYSETDNNNDNNNNVMATTEVIPNIVISPQQPFNPKFFFGDWDISEQRYITKDRVNFSESLRDMVTLPPYGPIRSNVPGSTGMSWKVINEDNGTIELRLIRGCSSTTWSRSPSGQMTASVTRPPKPPHDQLPTNCIYRGVILGNRIVGYVYKENNSFQNEGNSTLPTIDSIEKDMNETLLINHHHLYNNDNYNNNQNNNQFGASVVTSPLLINGGLTREDDSSAKEVIVGIFQMVRHVKPSKTNDTLH